MPQKGMRALEAVRAEFRFLRVTLLRGCELCQNNINTKISIVQQCSACNYAIILDMPWPRLSPLAGSSAAFE